MSGDDVKDTTFKEIKDKNKIKYKFTVYGEEHKQELNPDCRTNPIVMLVLGRVMLNLLQSRSLLECFSTTMVSINQHSSLAMISSPLPSSRLMLR